MNSSTSDQRLSMIMPMAGRGSRFSNARIMTPKPLIEIAGKPFFWWATESLRRSARLWEMVFVVLEEHCRKFDIDAKILRFYPDAKIARILTVTAGAAETAALGLRHLSVDGAIAINDCDHAFHCGPLQRTARLLNIGSSAATLLSFRSRNPAFSYAVTNKVGLVAGAVEKRVVSSRAIAGCYLFRSASLFLDELAVYRKPGCDGELFTSGICNLLAERGEPVTMLNLERHWSFGTPEDLRRVSVGELSAAFATTA